MENKNKRKRELKPHRQKVPKRMKIPNKDPNLPHHQHQQQQQDDINDDDDDSSFLKDVKESTIPKKHKKTPKKRIVRSPEEYENDCRRRAVGFIQNCGKRLKVPIFTVATAVVFFHRFFSHFSLLKKEYDRYEVATSCLFLAGKTEETPKKLDKVIMICQSHRFREDKNKKFDIESEEFKRLREKILRLERILLRTIDFDLKIDHPYRVFIDFMKPLKNYFPKDQSNTLAQKGWNFINDSFFTTACLRYKPFEIAICCIELAEDHLVTKEKTNFKITPTSILRDHLRKNRINFDIDRIQSIKQRLIKMFVEKNKAKATEQI